jgi:hypothetical protein
MKKNLMIGSALLLTIGVIGAATAAREIHVSRDGGREAATASRGEGRALQFAERNERNRHADRRSERRHHDDEEDGENRHGNGRAILPQAASADPHAPIPDNGLFNNKTRPKVEVQ